MKAASAGPLANVIIGSANALLSNGLTQGSIEAQLESSVILQTSVKIVSLALLIIELSSLILARFL